MLVATKDPDFLWVTGCDCLLEPFLTFVSASTLAMEDSDIRKEACGVPVRFPLDTQHQTDSQFQSRQTHRKGQQQPSARAKRVQPGGQNLGGACIDKDGIELTETRTAPVAGHDADRLVVSQVIARAGSELRVDLGADYNTARRNYLSSDRRVVTDATTDVKEAIARRQVESIEPTGQ
jgi:hypothetical protein